ncbi:MAG: hypothetical protein QG594_946, partial [Bacteroidota bacterium]|nr:hypothetical protein [Bacteroidota bacterium]
YSLFLPHYFDYSDFGVFNYNANVFGQDFEYEAKYESNVYDWYQFTHKKVSIEAINDFLNNLGLTDIQPDSKNSFIAYLYKNKAQEVLNYLKIAKKAEAINSLTASDPWERNEVAIEADKTNILNTIEKAYLAEKNAYLKRRYAFLVIRSAYYAGNKEAVKRFFENEFKNKTKDYLYYWSLFFNCFENPNSAVSVAQIMAHSKEKKYASYYFLHTNFDLKNALELAQNNQEKAAVYAYASMQKIDKNLDYLKEIYKNDAKTRVLSFLILREINKIEDWVYTPYYTNYLPSIEAVAWPDEFTISNTETLRTRSEKDRLYAKEVLDFINSINFSLVENPVLWKASQIQLLFITKNYGECLDKINRFERQYANQKVWNEVEKIKALCLVSNQEMNKAVIPQAVQAIILKNKNDDRFLFALGRELEFRGNIVDGLALIAAASGKGYEDYESTVEWMGNRLKTSGNLQVFYTYFDYLDFVYSAQQLKLIVSKLNSKMNSDFEKNLYSTLLKDKNYLIDLLGTKYIRENNLKQAYLTFKTIDNGYWEENYNAWEHDRFDDRYTFDANPFYDLKYTQNFIAHRDHFLVNKLTVTQYLIKYLNLANNPKTADRDYYYFLVANCYLNMTQKGNSWMLRRFGSTSYNIDHLNDSYIDEVEYFKVNLAQKYYNLAFKTAKTDQFKALCLRMIDFAKAEEPINFNLIKNAYPNFYDDLSSCENLSEFFTARR